MEIGKELSLKKDLEKIFSFFIFLITFILYQLAIYPAITNGDSGELISASYTLGISHPSGYPLYLILLKLFISILPFNEAISGNIFSSFFASLSIFLLYKNFNLAYNFFFKEENLYIKINSLLLSIAFGFTPILFSQAIITEVYTLNLFFLLLLNLIFLKFILTKNLKLIYLFAFISGVSLTNHPTPILILPFYGIVLYNKIENKKKLFLKISLLFLLGISIYFYLIIRANSNPIINWGNPSNFERMLSHILRKEYQESVQSVNRNFIYFIRQCLEYIKILISQFDFFIILIIPAIIISFKISTKNSLFIILLYLSLSIGFIYITNPKIDKHLIYVSRVFFIPSFVIIQFLIFLFISILIRFRKYFILISILFAIYIILKNFNSQRKNFIAYDFSRNILKTVEKDGILCTVEGDNPLFALGYLRFVEYLRPDITYCNRYGKIFISTFEYFKNLFSIEDKKIYFTSPERIEKDYEKYLTQIGILYHLKFKEPNLNFLNYFYLRTGNKLNDYMDKGLAAIYYYRLGYFYKEFLKNEKEYLKNLKLSEKFGDELKDIQFIIGNYYYSKNDFKNAKKCFERLIKITPLDSSPYFYYALCEIKLNNFENSIKYLLKAKELGEKSIEFYKALAYAYYKTSRIYEAIITIEDALKIYPQDLSLKNLLNYYENLIE